MDACPYPYHLSRFKGILEKKFNILSFVIGYYILNNIFAVATKMSRWDPNPAGSVSNRPLRSGSVSQDYISADQDPKEIFTVHQHCFLRTPCTAGFSSYILLSQKFSSLQTLYKVNVSTCHVPFLPKLSCKLSQFMNTLS
jgi:hypothetical protein